MNGQLLTVILIVTFATFLQITVSEKQLHRLVGGHLKIVNPDPYDAELLTAEASGSREKKNKSDDSEDKKTLSQQVADGKYGLIQNELFTKTPKRPGVLSYETNSEVPKDNRNNLGGLNKNEIWLAENHLLVLKGGTYPPHDDKFDRAPPLWPPIDDYKAPLRQVKIPAHPKVPPPFPVQLSDDGPLQILGTNDTRTLNGTIEATAYALPPPEGYEPGTGPYFPPFYPNQANIIAGQVTNSNAAKTSGEYPAGAPFPPFLLNGTLPPFFASLPPGAAIVPPPPPENLTDLYDEEDPSIYYPPPYSFFYPKYNGSLVPPGPLVPGIILPPPPNFFAPLEETTTTMKPRRFPITTTTQIPPQIHPTTTPLPSTKPKKPIQSISNAINEIKPVITTKAPKVITILPVRINKTTSIRQKVTQKSKKPAVTILRPIKTSTLPPQVFTYDNELKRTKPEQPKVIVTTTQVPLKVYYSTTNDIETNSVTPTPEKFHIGIGNPTKIPKTLTKPPAKYYFYEEDDNGKTNIVTPIPNYYREISTTPRSKQPYYNQYYVPPPNSRPILQPKPHFIYVTNRPYNTQRPKFRFISQRPKTDTFSIHIAKLQKQIQQFTTPKPYLRHSPKPVYQYSFEAANYHHPQNNYKPPQTDDDKFRPLPKYSVQIQQAVEVIPPKQITETITPVYEINYAANSAKAQSPKYYKDAEYDYEDEVPRKNVKQPHTISQYSFEVTQNPVHQGYYTKPDEGYFDDNTKKYFTVFGQKIAGSGTSPIPQIDQSTRNPIYNNRNLEGDIAVNYLTPRPPINPQAENVENVKRDKEKTQGNYSNRPVSNAQIVNPGYPQVVRYVPKTVRPERPPNLEGDTLVNYVHPRPNINAQAEIVQKNNNYPTRYTNRQSYNSPKDEPEIIKAIPVNVQPIQNQPPGSSYISYELPGDNGAHFYFLTPQLAQRRDQGVGYFYEKPNSNTRFRRNEQAKNER